MIPVKDGNGISQVKRLKTKARRDSTNVIESLHRRHSVTTSGGRNLFLLVT